MINRKFFRAHVFSGRSRPQPSGEKTDYLGTRKSGKRTKGYWKDEIDVFRLELELHARFLRRHRIEDPLDFHKLAQLLPYDHIWFAKIDDAKLIEHLRRQGFSSEDIERICRRLESRKEDIHAALTYLRKKVHLTNVRRLLTPLRTNKLIREALAKWAEQW